MSEKNFDFSDFSESVSNKPSNLKNDIFTTKIYNAKNGSNKSLLIVEKLSKKKINYGEIKQDLIRKN